MDYGKNIYAKETERRGMSIFAARAFAKGETIFYITGPITQQATTHTVPISEELYIDPISPGRYLNHACEPNVGIHQRTKVVAFTDIQKDDEILIDYAMIVNKYDQGTGADAITCQCGSDQCRGTLGSWETLPEELKEHYHGFVSEYILQNG